MSSVMARVLFLVTLILYVVGANDDLKFSINWSGRIPGNLEVIYTYSVNFDRDFDGRCIITWTKVKFKYF